MFEFFCLAGDHLFCGGKKPFQSTSKLIWLENLGQVLEQYFKNGAMENFSKSKWATVRKRLGTTAVELCYDWAVIVLFFASS